MDKPGVQGLMAVAHSQEIEQDIGLVVEVMAGEEGLCVSHHALGVIHQKGHCTPAGD